MNIDDPETMGVLLGSAALLGLAYKREAIGTWLVDRRILVPSDQAFLPLGDVGLDAARSCLALFVLVSIALCSAWLHQTSTQKTK